MKNSTYVFFIRAEDLILRRSASALLIRAKSVLSERAIYGDVVYRYTYTIMENRTKIEKIVPITLTLLVVALDQITKYIVVKTITPFTIGSSFFGGILRIVHVSNTGVAFSVGDSLPDTVRRFLFAILPLVVIAVVFAVYFRNNTFTKLQRWTICGIVGGGLGNLIDRFFRAEGVVDFIDVDIPNIAVPGLFSLERWPTFNIADASIVVCCAILIVSFMKTSDAENGGSGNGA